MSKFIKVPNGPGRTRFIPAESGDGRVKGAGTHWHNHESYSQGCHHTQVQQYRDFVSKMGLTGVEVTNSGRIKFESRHAMKSYAEARGQYNAHD